MFGTSDTVSEPTLIELGSTPIIKDKRIIYYLRTRDDSHRDSSRLS